MKIQKMVFSKEWDKNFFFFFLTEENIFPINKEKHEKVMSQILYCKQLHLHTHTYIYTKQVARRSRR